MPSTPVQEQADFSAQISALRVASPTWPAIRRERARERVPAAPSTTAFLCGDIVVDVAEDIRTLADVWPKLSEPAGATTRFAFQCRDHLAIWLETIGAARKVRPLFVRVADRSGKPMMLIPLGIEKQNGIRFLRFLDGGVADYNAPVLFDSAAWLRPKDVRALWSTICRAVPAYDVAQLEKMPRILHDRSNPLYALSQERWPVPGFEIMLPPGYGDRVLEKCRYFADSRRQRKRISEIGFLKFDIAKSERDIALVFSAFVRQKSRRFRETGARNGLEDNANLSYYLTLAQRLCGDGSVQLAYLSVNDEIIATHWGLVSGKRFYYLMPAYEGGDWRKFSPGRLLMEELVAWACRNGIEAFDLGIGDEPYKLHWNAEPMELGGGLYPRTWLGRMYCSALRARETLKTNLPPEMLAKLRAAKKYLST